MRTTRSTYVACATLIAILASHQAAVADDCNRDIETASLEIQSVTVNGTAVDDLSGWQEVDATLTPSFTLSQAQGQSSSEVGERVTLTVYKGEARTSGTYE